MNSWKKMSLCLPTSHLKPQLLVLGFLGAQMGCGVQGLKRVDSRPIRPQRALHGPSLGPMQLHSLHQEANEAPAMNDLELQRP